MPILGQAIYDLTRLFGLREAVDTLDLVAPPTVRLVAPHTAPSLRRVGILCGSFNPLTFAHTTLAEKAIEAFTLDQVFFTLAKVTVDKEQVTGMSLEDRLLSLSLYVEQHHNLGVALVNRGLYFEQAQAFHSLFGNQVELNFLIGMDKLLQIFDPRYYQDRDAALQQLFSLTSLIVANRGDMDEQSFSQLFDQPENHPFRQHVHFFTLPANITDLSATQVRHNLATEQPISAYVPPAVEEFINETRAHHPPQQCGEEQLYAYAVRQALLALLFTERSWTEQEIDFQRLMTAALSPDAHGRALRQAGSGKDIGESIAIFPLKPEA
ncbi:MAG: nicotinate-nicotinamide nucleotide adenylyltransferase [Deltaproteobacteria bacterium]|nr:nicotinate-nicotinamide nucleotide adenylyltransferase [Deltaproteobacteria bacterium]